MVASMKRGDRKPVLWRILPGLTPYGEAIAAMHAEQARIVAGAAREAVWLLESPAGFNPGGRSRPDQAPMLAGVPVDAPAGPHRGGDWSYHGPGVRAGIVMLDLRTRRRDVRSYVDLLHAWLIDAFGRLGVQGASRRPELEGAGVWIGDDKLAAIGLNVREWVTGYGFATYVAPELAHFAAIAPCGIADKGITSLAALGIKATMGELDVVLRDAFRTYFGPTSAVS